MTLYEQRLTEDLQQIRNRVLDISDRVCEALENTIIAIAENDRDALNLVVLNDFAINRDVRCLDKLCHEFVARHLPAAGHLRFISAVLRLTIALERAGDYSVTMSRVMLQLSKRLPERLINRIQEMSSLSVRMLRNGTQAFLDGDADAARETKRLDYQVDQAYDVIFSLLMEDGASREPQELVSLIKIFSKVERFSDQAKNVCEEAIFAATGQMKAPKIFKIVFVDEKNDLLSQLAEAIAKKAFPSGGRYTSAGWNPAKFVRPELERIADRFGFDVKRARTEEIGKLDTFPTPYHLVIALNLPDESVLPSIPYHTILRKWDIDEKVDEDSLVRDLSSRISHLMEKLRGKNGN